MRVSVLAAFALALIVGGAAGAVDVTSCGQVVSEGEVGSLPADLDCAGAPSGTDAVRLDARATLELNGNVITAPPSGNAISCLFVRRCTIVGPGWLLGAPLPSPTGSGVVSPKNVVIKGAGDPPGSHGIEIYGHSVGIDAPFGSVKISGVTLRNNGDGILAKVVKAERISVHNSERVGIRATRRVRGESVEIHGCGWAGIETKSFKLEASSAIGNGFDGTVSGGAIMATRRGTLRDSHISGNEFNDVPVDIATGRVPVLIDSTCSVSAVLVDGIPTGTWGICAAD